MPAVANCDELSVNAYEVVAVSLAVATLRNTAWTIAVPCASRRTSVHPVGAVIVGAPRAATAARMTSPVCTPTGPWIATDVPDAVVASERWPCTTIPVDAGGGVVVPADGVA